jgi:hypothetical protein
MMYSRAERVFILEHYFASKSFAAVREAFSSAHPDKELPSETTINRLKIAVFCLLIHHRPDDGGSKDL